MNTSSLISVLSAQPARTFVSLSLQRGLQIGRRLWLGATARPQPREAGSDVLAVRALADHYRRIDPGFAADLYAAADRHERDHDDECQRSGVRL